MQHFCFSSVLLLCAVGTVVAAPFRVGIQPDAKKNTPQPESRAKIIDAIRNDLVDVVDSLNKNDPSAQTRARQERILQNIDKLLQSDDDPPPNPSRSPSSNQSASKQQPEKQPSPASNSAKQTQPKESAQPQTPQASEGPMPSVGEQSSERNTLPRSLDEMQRMQGEYGGDWGHRIRRRLPEIDAVSRGRFVPRYEDVLREYYRALAEGNGRE